ncbi:sialidase family protein [Actinopolymorpha singaporensis]|uniref:Predicted neuraminidase (Sialidase) n=1 Tax=Actinopolymorpha singaporensis TaxID=117157 RepID=A0A1H1LRF4_9ACTN|nr:sialidase family protein [Actinopolymorpha singaporensis]SDR76605.1 Predicted neuraminidase (sialidase) [Actinopolymorpha singaporensis]
MSAASASPAESGSPASPARVELEFVVRDDPRFAACHASTVLPLPGGPLAAWFGGSREGAGDVAIWLSRRTPDGWSRPARVADEDGLPHWNPVLFVPPGSDAAGEVWLFYKVGRQIPSWRTRVIVSGDGGRTWSAPRELVPGDEGGRGPVKNKPIVLADGGWLAPASVERPDTWDAFADLSYDRGRTWQRSDFVPVDHATFPGKGIIQPTVWESAPGQVHMLVRSSCGWVCRSDSADGGRTWSTAVPTSLPNNNSGIDLAPLPDGRLVCVHNPVGRSWGVRTPLTAAISADNGHSWRHWATLDDEPARDGDADRNVEDREFSYPAAVTDGEGVTVTYTWRRRGIRSARLTPQDA